MTTMDAPALLIETKPPTGDASPSWHASIPTERCFFAIIEPSALGSPAPSLPQLRQMVLSRSPALDDALQRWVPLRVEDLHAAYTLLEPRSPREQPVVVACAVVRSTLDTLPEGTLVATPAALPACIQERLGDRAPAASSLNLLVGELQPPVIESARRRTSLVIAASVVLVIGLLAFGLTRRAAHDQARAESLLAAASAVEQRAAPREGQRPSDPHRARLLLAAEIARMRSASAGPADQGIDAAAALAEVLARWPRQGGEGEGSTLTGLYARLQSLQVLATGITLTVIVPADADPEPVLAGLRSLPGWQLQPTQRSLAPLGPPGKPEARLNLRLIPTPSSPSPAPSSSPALPS